jgi:hypothetical protein
VKIVKTAKGQDFDRFIFDLDTRFTVWSKQLPKTNDGRIMKSNAANFDMAFSFLTNQCKAPGCRYPLRDADNYYILDVGDVCNLCYAMYSAVKARLWFVEAQRLENEANRRPKGFGL